MLSLSPLRNPTRKRGRKLATRRVGEETVTRRVSEETVTRRVSEDKTSGRKPSFVPRLRVGLPCIQIAGM